MNTIDVIINFYGLLTNSTKLLTPLRYSVRKLADCLIPRLLSKECLSESNSLRPDVINERRIIISFTSFPARIERLWIVVRCMKRQSVKPDKIVLWLSKEQFEDVSLPESLTSLIDEQFEIRFVENDYRSHKKYCYAFREFKDDIVILIDDDIYYPSTMIEGLLNGLKKHPDAVICQYGSVMKYNGDGTLPPFTEWWEEKAEVSDSKDFFLGTGGGSLFQPNKLTSTILNTELAFKLTPLADDIWVNAMIRLSGLYIHKVKFGLLLQMPEQQKVALKNQNSYDGKNDEQFKSVIEFFTKEKDINPFTKREN